MYKSKLAVAIKHNGKILRENKDLVQLPFGSEFSVLVKNLNSRRVKFTLHIDGQDVLDGTEIIVNANSETEMKRFIRNGNMDEGNEFKFIERTKTIEDGPRGIKIDDGVVRVEFWFEKELPKITTTYHRDVWWNDTYRVGSPYRDRFYGTDLYNTTDSSGGSAMTKGSLRSMATSGNATLSNTMNATFSSQSAQAASVEAKSDVQLSDAGITVPGSKVEQKFHTVYGFNSEVQSEVIVLRLAGKIGNTDIVAPVTVKTKNVCSTCSHVNKHNAKFCSQCGTSLELV